MHILCVCMCVCVYGACVCVCVCVCVLCVCMCVCVTESMAEILRRHHLRWLGHVARMEDSRMPKQLLFGELERLRPRHGIKRRWRDLVVADVQAVGLEVGWTEKSGRRSADSAVPMISTRI